MRYLRYLICLLLLTIPLNAFGNKADIHEAGSRDLHLFLNSIPQGQEHLYGFSSREDFTDAILGRPIPMLTIDQHDDYSVVEINEWRLPVVIHSQTAAFLTVSRINGHWKAVEIGGTGLAREVSRIQDVEAILRLYSLKCDFVMLNQDRFMPLRSASIHLKEDMSAGLQYYTLDDIVELIKGIEK